MAVAVAAGGGLAALGSILAEDESGAPPCFLGAFLARQALCAAAASARLLRLRETEPELRDALILSPRDEDTGAGRRLLLVWKLPGIRGFVPDARQIARVLDLLDIEPAAGAERAAAYASLLSRPGAGEDPIGAAIGTARDVTALALQEEIRPETAEILGVWAADIGLARAAGWTRPVPLLATTLWKTKTETGRRPRPGDADFASKALRAYARAFVEAHATAADLERRAETLTAAARKLRTRHAEKVVRLILDEDGVAASGAAHGAGGSDRAMRRFFDTLVGQGALRELTGREMFRIYGL